MPKKKVLEATAAHTYAATEALYAVTGPRQARYGPPAENLTDIAATWTPYIRRAIEKKGYISAHDLCQLMVLLKAVRQVQGYHRDSAVDIIGYATLSEILSEFGASVAFDVDTHDQQDQG